MNMIPQVIWLKDIWSLPNFLNNPIHRSKK